MSEAGEGAHGHQLTVLGDESGQVEGACDGSGDDVHQRRARNRYDRGAYGRAGLGD